MADFGQLDEFFNDADFTLTWNGKVHEITIPTDRVMRFTVDYNKLQRAETERLDKALEARRNGASVDDLEPGDPWAETALVAKLLGGSFDKKTYKFKGCFLAELQDAGAPMSALNRMITAVSLKFIHGDLASEHYMETGDLREAITRFSGKARPSHTAHPSPETRKEAGETNEGA